MTNRSPQSLSRLAFVPVASLSVLGVLIVGCEGEPEPVAQVKQAPRNVAPPAPPPPSVTPVETLMSQLSIDERIFMAEDKAPSTDAERKAVLTYFDAFARGDADTLSRMMSGMDRTELEAMVDSGAWEKAIEGITEIEISTGRSPLDEACALALFTVEDGADIQLQPQLWYYTVKGMESKFDAVATPPNVVNSLYGEDWIRVWHELLEEEVLLANKLDVELDRNPIYVGGESPSGGGTAPGAAPRNPSKPGFSPPGGTPDRRPPGKKRKPPGAR